MPINLIRDLGHTASMWLATRKFAGAMSSRYITSPEQMVTILIVLVFPFAALIVLCVRIAGRASSRQFGWGGFT